MRKRRIKRKNEQIYLLHPLSRKGPFREPSGMADKGRTGTRSAFNLLVRAHLLLFHTRSSFEWPLCMITSYDQISPPGRMLLKRGTGE